MMSVVPYLCSHTLCLMQLWLLQRDKHFESFGPGEYAPFRVAGIRELLHLEADFFKLSKQQSCWFNKF
jgi:hypothetical protein